MAVPPSFPPAAPLVPPPPTPPNKHLAVNKHGFSDDRDVVDEVEEQSIDAGDVDVDVSADADSSGESPADRERRAAIERRVRLKVDLRLCTIAGVLCSLNLLDSGVISSAAVTSMPTDLGLTGNRFSVAVFSFTLSSIAFQLPSTLAARALGPRLWFAALTVAFGFITACTSLVRDWRQMIALRVLLGAATSGVYPGLTYLISTWYPRREQQTRFALLQSGEVIMLATGSIVNYGINNGLGGRGAGGNSMEGWRYMFLVQGLIAVVFGGLTYLWIVDFPENAHRTPWFLTAEEQAVAVARIEADRADVAPGRFGWRREVLRHALDAKVWGFAALFFLLNLVSTSLSYFLPAILRGGMGFSEGDAILLSAPPYYYAVVPVLASSAFADRFRLRAPVIAFNCACLIAGFAMLGFAGETRVATRYAGTFLATGAYVSNWAALSAYQANNVAGQWKRAFTAAAVTAMNGAGGIAGSFVVRAHEAPRYETAVWVAIASHLLMIVLVAVFSLHFYLANRRADAGKVVLEGRPDFRYTY